MTKPIPKAPRAPLPALQSPIEKAIADLMKNTTVGSPSAVLMNASKTALEAALREAWNEAEKKAKTEQALRPLTVGRPKPTVFTTSTAGQPIPAGMVQTVMQQSQLEHQLEESLWAMATLHEAVWTRDDLYKHVGTGHMTDDWYVKRVQDTEVLLLCRCKRILVLSRCRYDDALTGQCEEPAFPREATLKKDTRCTLHEGL